MRRGDASSRIDTEGAPTQLLHILNVECMGVLYGISQQIQVCIVCLRTGRSILVQEVVMHEIWGISRAFIVNLTGKVKFCDVRFSI